ncbi:MAG: ASCH domain-containing protein [Phycisphaerae bacterium]|nr:ASCH domain-containing protein [Phycisphaerae bacterium]
MKALTIRQPWAWAIIFGGKNIENRSWRTRYRGPVLIHAGAAYDPEVSMPRGVRAPVRDKLQFSALIGVVELTDVVEKSRSPWFQGEYGFVLAKPRPLKPPIRCSGRLGLWTPSAGQIRAVRARLKTRRIATSGRTGG